MARARLLTADRFWNSPDKNSPAQPCCDLLTISSDALAGLGAVTCYQNSPPPVVVPKLTRHASDLVVWKRRPSNLYLLKAIDLDYLAVETMRQFPMCSLIDLVRDTVHRAVAKHNLKRCWMGTAKTTLWSRVARARRVL
jgi:hypothetical protein